MAAARAKQLFLLHRNFKAEAAELCQFMEEVDCCSEVLQVFDAGSGVERDVRLLGEAMDRTVGVAQDGNGCMIPHLSGSQQEQMCEALCTVKKVIDGSCLDQLQIQSILVKHVSRLPLEALWTLHQHGTLRLDHLFTGSASSCLPHLVDTLVMTVRAGQRGRAVGVLQGVVRELVQLGYGSGRGQESSKVAQELLMEAVQRSFAEGSWEPEGEDGREESAETSDELERLSLLDAIRSGDNSCAEVFVEDLLGAVFQHTSTSLAEVVSTQCSCVHSSLPCGRRTMLSQSALILPLDSSMRLIWTHLQHKQLPWRGVLDYLSCLLHAVPQAGQQIAALLCSNADKALQLCDSHMLRCVLIVARQASLEGPHIFRPYHLWFQGMFGNSPKTLVSTKRQLMCLLQTLKELVPNEPAAHLKAHLRSPPRGLAKCHEAVHSYLSAVRARLKELNEPVDLTDSQPTAAGGHQPAHGDVLAALLQFRDTKRVPQSVMQASLFKKPYYIGRFLPALLTGGVEVDPELRTTRHQLISELRRAGKVPIRLLEEYNKQTSAAANTDMDHSSPAADVLLKDVRATLNQVSTAVGQEEHRRVSTALSKLSDVLCQSCQQLGPCLKEVTLTAPGLQPLQLQVVDIFLTSMCEIVAACAESKAECSGAGEDVFCWLGQLVQVFVGVAPLIAPLVVRLWDLLSNKLGELSDSHLCGLAVLCRYLTSINSWAELTLVQRGRGGWWMDQTHPFGNSEVVLKSGEECVVFLINGLSSRTWEETVRSLRFLHVFLHHSLSADSPADSPTGPPLAAALQWFTCLKRRVAQLEGHSTVYWDDGGPTRKRLMTEAAQLLSDCDKLEAVEPLHSAFQAACLLPLSAWLASELAFTSDEQHGALVRSSHLLDTALESYLKASSSTGGFGGDLHLLFCELFAILSRLCVAGRVGVEGHQCGLALLQSVIQAVVAGQPTDPLSVSPPTLVAAVRHTMSVCVSEGETSGLDRAAVQAFKAVLLKGCLQVCSHLPSHLLVTDTAAAVGQTDLSVLAAVLLADHARLLYEHRLLPLSVVCLVMQGFLATLRLPCDREGVASLFEQLVTHAPLFFGSLCYWRDSLPHSWSGDLSAVVGPMKDKMAVVLELVSGSAVDRGKGPLSPTLSSDNGVLITAAVCAFARLSSTSSHSGVQGLLHRLLQFTVDIPQHDKVCTTMLDLVLTHLDELVLTEGGDNRPHPLLRVAATCLERCPSVAIAMCKDPLPAHEETWKEAQLLQCLRDFRKSYPTDSSATFARPLSFFWVVRNMAEQSLVQLCQHSCAAAVVRRMYDSCLALQSDPSIAQLARGTDRHLLQPFSVEFLQHISSIVRRALPS